MNDIACLADISMCGVQRCVPFDVCMRVGWRLPLVFKMCVKQEGSERGACCACFAGGNLEIRTYLLEYGAS